jgi:hypothetical protein
VYLSYVTSIMPVNILKGVSYPKLQTPEIYGSTINFEQSGDQHPQRVWGRGDIVRSGSYHTIDKGKDMYSLDNCNG